MSSSSKVEGAKAPQPPGSAVPVDWMVFLRKALDKVSARYISEPGLYLQHRTAGVVTEVNGEALELKREASCKSIPEVCGQSTKSAVFQMCSGDCVLARRPSFSIWEYLCSAGVNARLAYVAGWPSYNKANPRPFRDASPCPPLWACGLKYLRTGACVTATLRDLRACSCSWIHCHSSSLCVSCGEADITQTGYWGSSKGTWPCQWATAHPARVWTSTGVSMFTMASIFLGSSLTPSLLNRCPMNVTCRLLKSNFAFFNLMFLSLHLWNKRRRFPSWSLSASSLVSPWPVIRRSSAIL